MDPKLKIAIASAVMSLQDALEQFGKQLGNRATIINSHPEEVAEELFYIWPDYTQARLSFVLSWSLRSIGLHVGWGYNPHKLRNPISVLKLNRAHYADYVRLLGLLLNWASEIKARVLLPASATIAIETSFQVEEIMDEVTSTFLQPDWEKFLKIKSPVYKMPVEWREYKIHDLPDNLAIIASSNWLNVGSAAVAWDNKLIAFGTAKEMQTLKSALNKGVPIAGPIVLALYGLGLNPDLPQLERLTFSQLLELAQILDRLDFVD